MRNTSLKTNNLGEVLDTVNGKVFHVTSSANISKIIKDGGLTPNFEGTNLSPFGNTENAFFRNLGCVSFFDYRGYNTLEWKEHAYKCCPFQALDRNKTLAFLFLSENYYSDLVPLIKWKELGQLSMRVVPHVEIGFKGKVPLQAISSILSVEYKSS